MTLDIGRHHRTEGVGRRRRLVCCQLLGGHGYRRMRPKGASNSPLPVTLPDGVRSEYAGQGTETPVL